MRRDHLFHMLDAPKVESIIVQTRNHCLKKCVKNPQCFSTKVAAVRRPEGNVSHAIFYQQTGTVHRKRSERITVSTTTASW